MSQHIDLQAVIDAKPRPRGLAERLLTWVERAAAPTFVAGAPCCEGTRRILDLLHSGATGAEVASSPRHATVLIIVGPVNEKLSPRLRLLYEQLALPRRVIAVGACSVSGGPTAHSGGAVTEGIAHVVPVDVHIGGCPPDPGALAEALALLSGAAVPRHHDSGDRARRPRDPPGGSEEGQT